MTVWKPITDVLQGEIDKRKQALARLSTSWRPRPVEPPPPQPPVNWRPQPQTPFGQTPRFQQRVHQVISPEAEGYKSYLRQTYPELKQPEFESGYIPAFNTFNEQFFAQNGLDKMPTEEVMRKYPNLYDLVANEYGATYGGAAAKGSQIAGTGTAIVGPALGKRFDPSKPEITPADYLLTAGNIVANVAAPGWGQPLSRVGLRVGMGLLAAGQTTGLVKDWERMTPAERAAGIAMSTLSTAGAVLPVAPKITQGAKAAGKAAGRNLAELTAQPELGMAKIPKGKPLPGQTPLPESGAKAPPVVPAAAKAEGVVTFKHETTNQGDLVVIYRDGEAIGNVRDLKGELEFRSAGLDKPVRMPSGRDGLDLIDQPAAERMAKLVPTETAKAEGAALPKELAGAKPRYNIGTTSYEPVFESDVDKALFIVAQTTKSKRDADYLSFLTKQFPDLSEAQIRANGIELRTRIKALAHAQLEGGSLKVQASQPPKAPTVNETLTVPKTEPSGAGGKIPPETPPVATTTPPSPVKFAFGMGDQPQPRYAAQTPPVSNVHEDTWARDLLASRRRQPKSVPPKAEPPVEPPLPPGGRPPLGNPPAPPAQPVPPAKPPVPFKGVQIPTVTELLNRVKGQKLEGVQGKVFNLPVVRTVAKLVDPIAVTDDFGVVLSAISGMIDDIAHGGTIVATSRVIRQAGFRAKPLFKLDEQALSLATDIKQLSALPTGKASKALHDMVEFANRYDFGTGAVGDARRSLIQQIRETSKKISNMLRNEGILVDGTPQPGQIKVLAGESDFQFLHRVLLEVKEESAGGVASKLANAIDKSGLSFTRLTDETNYQYVGRFAQQVKEGIIKTTATLDDLLDDFANLADVKIKRSALNQKRKWDTVAEGLKAGETYETNIVKELTQQVRASYALVKKKRLSEAVLKMVQTTTPEERVGQTLGRPYSAIREAKLKSDQLVSYLQRIKRGESPSGMTTSFIKEHFPSLEPRLKDALNLLPKQREALIRKAMAAINKALLVTGTDAVNIAKRERTLLEIKRTFDANPELTISDIAEVIAQTVKDKNTAARATREAYLTLSKAQKSAISGILEDAKTLNDANNTIWQEARNLRRKFADRMGAGGTEEYGQVIGLPGLGNRVVVSQGGKTGRDVAKELNEHFGYVPNTDVLHKAVEGAGKVGAIMRMGRLAYDISASLIQQALSLGYDIRNLVMLKPTSVWAKSTGGSLKTLFSKEMTHLEDFIAKNEDLVIDYVQRGGLLETGEMVEGAAPLQSLLEKSPLSGKPRVVADWLGRHVLGRSEAVFTTARVESGINLYKAGFRMASREGKLDEWAKLTNNMTGVLSTRAMGISTSQRSLESAMGWMSPRFTRSAGAILYDIFTNPTGYTAKQAGTSLAALIGAGTVIYLGVNAAQGKESTLNPFDPKFGNVEVGERTYRLGGIISDLRRLLAVIDATVYAATGKRISLSGKEDNTPSLDQLALQQFSSKTSPITGTGMDVYKMLLNRNFTDYDGNKLTWTNILGNWISPSWADPLLNQEPDALPGAAGGFIGLNTNPIRSTTAGGGTRTSGGNMGEQGWRNYLTKGTSQTDSDGWRKYLKK